MAPFTTADLDAIPRLGWVRAPTEVTDLPRTADVFGLAHLAVKRDDLLPPLHGGSKPRKLEYILAREPFTEAPAWASPGAIGSGSLVALTDAARTLGRKLEAYMFWTPLSEGTTENLAFTASGPTTIHYHGSRTTLALFSPSVLIGKKIRGAPVIAAGATTAAGMLGSLRAGLELCEQIKSGEVPEPERLYVAFGSGGTAVGLAMGLAMGGVATVVSAIAVVERPLATQARVRSLQKELTEELARWKIPAPKGPLPLVLDHAFVGGGYAIPTKESLAACETLAHEDIHLEPVYTGKAMAAVLADVRRHGLRNALFWLTKRRGPLPEAEGWRDKLPRALRKRLDAEEHPPKIPRRKVLMALGAAAAIGVAIRVTGYPDIDWYGEVLTATEALVLRAAAEVLVPEATRQEIEAVADRVDLYVVGLPRDVQWQIHGMLALIEHATPILGERIPRFTRLDIPARDAYLRGLEAAGGTRSQAYRGLRDLVMLGLYQQPSTWMVLEYNGPKVALDYDPHGPQRLAWPAYDAMVAPAGALPKAVVK
ncbi:MAG: pyridoxal-phosphate dependent enzyme [Polyangiaceae bacterium]